MREYERKSRWTPWHVLAVLLILGVLVVTLVLIDRLTGDGPTGSLPSQVPARPTPTPALSGVTPGELPAARPTRAPPATTNPTATTPGSGARPRPAASFSDEEAALSNTLRVDATVNCAPRRTDLPTGAFAGVECRPSAGPAERVGIYGLDDEREAALVYLERMTQAGVRLGDSNSCVDGGFDTLWVLGEDDLLVEESESAVEYQGALYDVHRWGCFINEDGVANIRVLCGGGLYVGVLGRSGDMDALLEWTQESPDGSGDTSIDVDGWHPPGICVRAG